MRRRSLYRVVHLTTKYLTIIERKTKKKVYTCQLIPFLFGLLVGGAGKMVYNTTKIKKTMIYKYCGV